MATTSVQVLNTKPIPVIVDFRNARDSRQNVNELLAKQSIQDRNIRKHINIKAWERVKERLNIPDQEIFENCEAYANIATLIAMLVSINSSRQGTRDEELQISTCNMTSEKCGVNITQLNTTDFRATKNGDIITNKQFKDDFKLNKISKNDCLKSFDAKISGKVNGWLFAKVVIGSGGHQDNVFEEAHTSCEWWVKYGRKDELFVVLCDTDLEAKFVELKEKYKNTDNIIIGNHITIQQYFIDNYFVAAPVPDAVPDAVPVPVAV